MLNRAELEERARIVTDLGATTEIVGCWVWAKFTLKPLPHVRDQMVRMGFHWNGTRHVWQLAGRPARRSPESNEAIKNKYGAYSFANKQTSHAAPRREPEELTLLMSR